MYSTSETHMQAPANTVTRTTMLDLLAKSRVGEAMPKSLIDVISREPEVTIERSVNRSKLMTGKVSHNKWATDTHRDALMAGWVVYRRKTIYNWDGSEELEYASAQYQDKDRLGRWSDKLNPLSILCTKIAVRKHVDIVPTVRKVPQSMPMDGIKRESKLHVTKRPERKTDKPVRINLNGAAPRDNGSWTEAIWVIDAEKVAYWAEKMLRVVCAQCNGTGKVDGKVCQTIRGAQNKIMERGCQGRGHHPMYTAWTWGKINYAMQLQAKKKWELAKGSDLIEVETTDGPEFISMPRPKDYIVFEMAKDGDDFLFAAYNEPVKSDDFAGIPTEPYMIEGDVVVGDWQTAMVLIEAMRKIERKFKSDGEWITLKPFYGMDPLFDMMYCHNGECTNVNCEHCDGNGGIDEGRYLRLDPNQIARKVNRADNLGALRAQVRLGIVNRSISHLGQLIQSIENAKSITAGGNMSEIPWSNGGGQPATAFVHQSKVPRDRVCGKSVLEGHAACHLSPLGHDGKCEPSREDLIDAVRFATDRAMRNRLHYQGQRLDAAGYPVNPNTGKRTHRDGSLCDCEDIDDPCFSGR